ncbi:MAG: type II toxin-antitoxin system VapB family antitoxin [Candidatus Solibacter usitatus]|nr:type II toxin-antitoxin system VapB family antitoxin [Candidatus Solibacter usitatus]
MNVVLDADVLKEAMQFYGEKTYSGAINRALKEAVRQARIKDLVSLFGKVEWEGDLGEMREDHKFDDAWERVDSAKSGT